MAVDFQVVFPSQLVELVSVRELGGIRPRTLDVLGKDFRSVDEVLVNGMVAPEVVIVSMTRLLVQVPDVFVHQTVTSVSVVSRELTVSGQSLLRFRVGRTPSKVSGVLRLMQVFLKVLFTTPGSDIFAPGLGGAALRNVGQTFGRDEGGAIISDFVIAVNNTKRQLLAIQARDPSTPRSERLLAAKVNSAGYNRSEGALVVSVELTSQEGRAATANVTV